MYKNPEDGKIGRLSLEQGYAASRILAKHGVRHKLIVGKGTTYSSVNTTLIELWDSIHAKALKEMGETIDLEE